MPPFSGSLFRDVFGSQLKKVVCLYRKGQCDTCPAVKLCDYARFVEMPRKVANGNQKGKGASRLRPFVIEPPAINQTDFPAGASFILRLLLFGPAVESAPSFIRAVEAMGKGGLARRRGKFSISQVICGQQVVAEPGHSPQIVMTPPAQIHWPDLEDPPEAGEQTLTVRLQTPLKVKQDGQNAPELSFQGLVRMTLRRIADVLKNFGEGEPDVDYKALLESAGTVRTLQSELAWYDWRNHVSRRDRSLLKGSILGSVSFQGQIAVFRPLLDLGRQLHIGRQTECGLGQFDLSSSADTGA
ncbi:MAG: CRISPR system precrRNA processing endoribonuclease RAMP protein Cas6 [Desulfosudaceae bacterium]